MKRTIVLLGLIVLALGGTSTYLWRQLQDEREFSERSLRRAVELEVRLAERDPGEIADSRPELLGGNTIPTPQSTTMPQPTSRPSSESGVEPDASGDARQPRNVKLAQQRVLVYSVFPELAAALDLEDEEAEALVNLLAEHRLDSEENPPHVPEGQLHWDASNKPDWVREMEDRQRARDREIAELLGPDRFRAWQDYVASAEARRLVRELRPLLDGTSDSLREDQMTLLINSITEARRQFAAESASNTWSSDERFAKYNQRLREAAVPYLSERQLRRFEQMLDRHLEELGRKPLR